MKTELGFKEWIKPENIDKSKNKDKCIYKRRSKSELVVYTFVVYIQDKNQQNEKKQKADDTGKNTEERDN